MKLVSLVTMLLGMNRRWMTMTILALSGIGLSADQALGQETIAWASGSPTSPESGWIQGAGTVTIQNKKVFVAGVIMFAKKGESTTQQGGDLNLNSDPKTWQALIVGLSPGEEYEVWAVLTVTYEDLSPGKAESTKKKITVKTK